jgi:hypothetical protein
MRMSGKMNMTVLKPSQNTALATQNAHAQIHWWVHVKMRFVRKK